ncbi:MAG TPA: alpha-L-rhamnosidase C-terminal domain-containing protein [Prolixibacteraceae bacterium]|nr:alpha-L-rhamnosidase C-terminal domain-containing protein [Prolixibacteraceae bacterium]
MDPMQRMYLTPQRVVWISSDSLVQNTEVLLKKGDSQAYFARQDLCRIENRGEERSGILLDFGIEIHGGIQITTSKGNNAYPKVRLRFGESVSEACGDLHTGTSGYGGGLTTNHHAMRDFELSLPGYGTITVGNTGFRFLRIDLVGPDEWLAIKEVRAVAVLRDIPYVGSFRCNDDRLNQIWQTGAYTVHLCMQDYLWDGIKRDRMVWAGDMHPEVMTINAVFGYHEVVPKTLDFLRETTPLPRFMNGISSYSMWWIIMQHDWYLYHGRLDYLQKQKEYLLSLLETLAQYVDSEGREELYKTGRLFLDWPTAGNNSAIHAGLQALMAMTFEKGAVLCFSLGENTQAQGYKALAAKMRTQVPDDIQAKQAAALLSLSGLIDAGLADREVINVDGPKKFSTFYGYYMLQAQALAGNYEGAMDNISRFWGGMLDLGATTFWEDFDLDEAENAAPIDDFVPVGKLDYHKDTGKECYIGLRRSLCHGWASGPTAWLSEHVLGIQVLEPGCKKVKIEPHLGNLEWVEGSFPTPMGPIKVKHRKEKNGEITSEISLPDGVELVE